jgi:hypothetical protein
MINTKKTNDIIAKLKTSKRDVNLKWGILEEIHISYEHLRKAIHAL